MSKRIFLLFFVICTLFLPVAAVNADSGFTVRVKETSTPVPGESFTVDMEVAGNPGITAFAVTLNYDSKTMTLTSASFSDFLDEDSRVSCTRRGNTLTVNSSQPITRSGVWITLTFKLASDVTLGSYPIGISAENGAIVGEGGAKLSPAMIAGGVNLECYHKYHKEEVADPTCSSEGFTVYRCTECRTTYISDYVAKLPHTWQNQSTTAATCTRPATLTRSCRVCGETETVETSRELGHSYTEEVVEPTCKKGGYTLHQCSRCDDSYRDHIVPVTGHKNTKTFIKEATCAETGYELYSCVYCGLSEHVVLPTLEHTWNVEQISPTHTHGGWSLYTCSACGLSMRGEFIDLLEYDYEFTVALEPTCTEPGYRIGICKDGCGHENKEEIPAEGHSFGEWEQLRSASIYRTGHWQTVCTRCGYTYEASTPKLEGSTGSLSANEPLDPLSLSFWRDVFDWFIHDTIAVSIAAGLFGLLFLLILIVEIRRAVLRSRDTSTKDLEDLADSIEKSPPNAQPPENFGDEFGHDYQDLGLPAPSVIVEAYRILNETGNREPKE